MPRLIRKNKEGEIMSNDPLVSIIVPLYNCEEYIVECISSISCQTYRNIEIVVVDDGSNDKSFALVDQLKMDDDRIKLISQENSGVSSARNKGIEIASGEFLIFVDSDDTLDNNVVEKLVLEKLKGNGLTYARTNLFSGVVIEENKRLLVKHYLHTRLGIPYGCLGKLYTTKIIKDHNIRFRDGLVCDEDLFFNVDYFSYEDYGTGITGDKYNVRIRLDSLTKVRKKNNIPVYVEAYQYINEKLGPEYNYDNAYACFINSLNDLIQQVKGLRSGFKKKYQMVCLFWSDSILKGIVQKHYGALTSDRTNHNFETLAIKLFNRNRFVFAGFIILFCKIVAFRERKR